MAYITRTEEFGQIRFTAPNADEARDGYVWIETELGYASRGRCQICYGGGFRGNTVTTTTRDLKETAQKWLRARRRWLRKGGW